MGLEEEQLDQRRLTICVRSALSCKNVCKIKATPQICVKRCAYLSVYLTWVFLGRLIDTTCNTHSQPQSFCHASWYFTGSVSCTSFSRFSDSTHCKLRLYSLHLVCLQLKLNTLVIQKNCFLFLFHTCSVFLIFISGFIKLSAKWTNT